MESLFPHLVPRWVLTRTTKAFPIHSQTLHCYLARFFTLSLRPNRERLLQWQLESLFLVTSRARARTTHGGTTGPSSTMRTVASQRSMRKCQHVRQRTCDEKIGESRGDAVPGTSAESCDRKYRSDVKTGSAGHCNCSFGGKKRPIADEWLDRSCGPALPNPRQLSSVFHFHM